MRKLWSAIPAALLGGLAACGGPDRPLVNVSGSISLNGEPLPGAEVVFVPVTPAAGLLVASDTTGPQGNYKLKTGDAFGVRPGRYNVTVRKPIEPSAEATRLHPNDPFMARLSSAMPDLPGVRTRGARKVGEAIEERLPDREVSRDGAIIDIDIKAVDESQGPEAAPAKKPARSPRKGRG